VFVIDPEIKVTDADLLDDDEEFMKFMSRKDTVIGNIRRLTRISHVSNQLENEVSEYLEKIIEPRRSKKKV